jgi:hypothetical protein
VFAGSLAQRRGTASRSLSVPPRGLGKAEAERWRRHAAPRSGAALISGLWVNSAINGILLSRVYAQWLLPPASRLAAGWAQEDRIPPRPAATNPDPYRPDLATSLTRTATILQDLMQHSEAQQHANEAERLRRPTT